MRFAGVVQGAAFVTALCAGILTGCSAQPYEGAANEGAAKEKVLLMTSLPLIWGEGASMEDVLAGNAAPAAIYKAWQERYEIEAVDSFEGLEASDADIVILAQPRAMAPADLASFDEWVRAGGRALILTDPMLVWPSELALGDKRRPLATGLLSPLLKHWGIEMLAPDEDSAGGVAMGFDDYDVQTAGVGTFAKLAPNGECKLINKDVMARCRIGEGQAIVVADADFLNQELWGDEAPNKSGAVRLTDNLLKEMSVK